MAGLRKASLEAVCPKHSVIDEAIRDKAENYTVFSVVCSIALYESMSRLCPVVE